MSEEHGKLAVGADKRSQIMQTKLRSLETSLCPKMRHLLTLTRTTTPEAERRIAAFVIALTVILMGGSASVVVWALVLLR